jgi:hypothetical protein
VSTYGPLTLILDLGKHPSYSEFLADLTLALAAAR